MRVAVSAGGWAQRYLGGAMQAEVDVPNASTALEAALLAGLPEDEIGLPESGGRRIEPEQALGEGQTLRVYPNIIRGKGALPSVCRERSMDILVPYENLPLCFYPTAGGLFRCPIF